MRKTIGILFVWCICLCSLVDNTFAFGYKEHNELTEYVIFGDKEYSKNHSESADIVKSLHCATYLCVDQFNYRAHAVEDDERLKLLKERKIPGLPESVERDINYTAFGEKHRSYTHRGWNHSYSQAELEKSHWEARKELLISTVKKEFDPGMINEILSFFGDDDAEALTDGYDKKCESFAELLYYCHLLGDHIYDHEELEASGRGEDQPYYVKNNLILSLGGSRDNASIIHDLKECLNSLFSDQKKKVKPLISELDRIEKNIDYVRYEVGKVGGLNTVGRYLAYSSYAQEVADALHEYVPNLLKEEAFFLRVFTG